jgi:hypothetical protein
MQCAAASCSGGTYAAPAFCDGMGNPCPAGATTDCSTMATNKLCDPAKGCVAGKYVFVTSMPVLASFGGTAQGDAQCQALAQPFGGTWMSWTSDSSSSPAARFTHSTIPYGLLDGTLVASDWTGLTSGSLLHAIDIDETGAVQAGTPEVWTATDTGGNYDQMPGCMGCSCGDWTMPVHTLTAWVGRANQTDGTWTAVFPQFCDYNYQRLYCFQQ